MSAGGQSSPALSMSSSRVWSDVDGVDVVYIHTFLYEGDESMHQYFVPKILVTYMYMYSVSF